MALKSDKEIALMRRAGLLLWEAHQVAADLVRSGITTAEIDAAVEGYLLAHHAVPLFKGQRIGDNMPFPATTCISVNEEVVHGIPGLRVLKEGDVVSVDLGCRLNGWCADAAVTHAVGVIGPQQQRLLGVTEEALRLAITLMGQRSRWSEVARELEQFITGAGFGVVKGLAGHGIGRELWEPPQAPNFYSRDYERYGDFRLEPGIVVAVEPMVTQGRDRVRVLPDGWTIVTQDGLPAAHFEHTIAITRGGPQVLTAGPDGVAWATGSAHLARYPGA
jgi:methionyl aminopeptidase